ncbi:MAG: hypothetical protein IPL77_11255 [Flavobacteriales bacterium]|nr:hypothetical protein [Flavobacteriales bacterium]
MPNAAAMKMAFNGGELSPLLDGRTDLAKYASGCSIMENYIPTVHGPIRRRPGTRFVADAGTLAPVLVPFVFNRTQSYVLAIASEITVYSARGVVEASPGVPYTFGDGIWTAPPRREDGTVRIAWVQSGDMVFVCDAAGGLPMMVIRRLGHTNWTIEAYEMATPPHLKFDRDNNFKIFRTDGAGVATDDGEWWMWIGAYTSVWSSVFEDAKIRGKVFIDLTHYFDGFAARGFVKKWSAGMTVAHRDIVVCNGRYYHALEAGTLSSSELSHTSLHGPESSIMAYIGNGIIAFDIISTRNPEIHGSSPDFYTIYSALVKFAESPSNEYRGDDMFCSSADRWVESFSPFHGRSYAFASLIDFVRPFGDAVIAGEYPDNVAIFRDRLVVSANRQIWMSVAGDLPNFSEFDASGDVTADAAVNLELLSGDLSPVSWMSSADRLVLGSFGGERAIGEQNISDPFGPLNAKVDASGAYGALDIQPSVVGSDVLFVDRSGRRVRRSGLNLSPDDAADLSLLSEHLGAASPFVDMAYQMTPGAVLWLVQANGSLVGMTYDRVQDVAAWHRHDVGGDVLAVCSTPSPDGTRDDLWMVVEREVDGETVFYVEVLVDEFALGTPVEDQCFLDCSLSYSGAPADVISGLDHLEGGSVAVLADGSVLGPFTVASGEINLGGEYSKVHVGLAYSSRLRTMRLEKQTTDGSSIGKIGRVHRVVLRLLDSVGIKIGATFDTMDRKEFRRASVPQNSPVPISTTDLGVDFPGGHNVDQYVCIEQDQPLPSTILSMGIEYGVQG